MTLHAFTAFLGLALMAHPATNFEHEAIQSRPEPAQAPGNTAPQTDFSSTGSFRPGAGTVIVAELSRPLETKKLNVDDPVECRVTQDLLYQGKIIIPRGSMVIGHVTEVVSSSKEHPQSRLGLIFEKIVLKDKRELPFQFPAIVAALVAPIRRSAVPTTRPDQMPVQMQKGRTTGGALIDALDANASLAGANMPSSTGAASAANRGVIGLKGLALDPPDAKGAVIVSAKGDVKIDSESQLVLRVIGPDNAK